MLAGSRSDKPLSAAKMQQLAGVGHFEQWAAAITKLNSIHEAAGAEDESGSSFGTPASHDPATEKVRSVNITGKSAVVETVNSQNNHPEFVEYTFVDEDGSWKIAKQRRFFDAENKPAFAPAVVQALISKVSPSAALSPPDAGDEPNGEVLFKAGHVMKGTLMEAPEAVRVRKVGKIGLPSGTIVVRDFGYSADEALPLSLAVTPGTYDVEVRLLDRCIAAVRVILGPEDKGPFHYKKAVNTEGAESIGVDAGNVIIADARAFMSRTMRRHERD